MMKQQHRFLIILLLGIGGMVPWQAYAQEEDSAKVSRWEIGMDLLSLIDKNNFPEYSLFARYRLNPKAEKATSLRLRAGFGFQSYLDSATVSTSRDLDIKHTSTFLMVGIQKEVFTSRISSVYLGSDLSYSQRKSDYDFNLSNKVGYEKLNESNYGIHLLLGYSIQLTQSFQLSMESSLSLIIREYAFKEDVFFYNEDGDGTGGRIRDNWSSRIETQIRPFHQLLFTYKL